MIPNDVTVQRHQPLYVQCDRSGKLVRLLGNEDCWYGVTALHNLFRFCEQGWSEPRHFLRNWNLRQRIFAKQNVAEDHIDTATGSV